MVKKTVLLLCVPVVLIACSQKKNLEHTLFTRLSSGVTGLNFKNEIKSSQQLNLFTYRNFYNGGGVALGDINNDGLLDIYITANQDRNRLYLNKGDFKFRDITDTSGVAGTKHWSTGVSMVDVNGDGLLDIYVLNSGNVKGENRRNELFINQGDLTFKEEASKYNLDDNAFTTHAVFFDYDGDGDLDCYLLNNNFTGQNMKKLFSKKRDEVNLSGGDKLLRNDNGEYIDTSKEAGIYRGELGFGLGIAVGDVNGDLKPDIYISNDFWERDYLYINEGDGTFSEELVQRTSHISHSSMGNDIADINNDGMLDIFVTDMLPASVQRIKTMTVFDEYRQENVSYHNSYHYQYVHNTLQVNNGNGTFREMGFISGVAATDWSWAALIFDFDNNGWNDIYVTNGIFKDITDLDFQNFIRNKNNIARIVREKGEFNVLDFLDRIPSKKIGNFAFLNNKDLTFSFSSDSLGFHESSFSNGAAYGDLDNDGDLDLIVNNLNEEAFIYRNNAEKRLNNHYLRVKFEGDNQNTFGIGTHVKIFSSGNKQIAENIPSRSFQSTVPPYVHFGLGRNTFIDSLFVIWPNHQMQVLKNVHANQEITVRQELADQKFKPNTSIGKAPIIKNVTQERVNGNIEHEENSYMDFDEELLLPHMLSTEGPRLTKGDINVDGLEDFIMTGASGNKDKIYAQQTNGTFNELKSRDLEMDSSYESTAAALIDIDGDGDLDLMVANGGNQPSIDSDFYKIRVYENNGSGRYTRASHMAPNINVNASCILVNDYDGDGDEDIFIGGRVVPNRYGENPQSYLLANNGVGNWTDVTPERLKRPGMVTDAIWTDYDNNGTDDLIVVGEWMPITFYSNKDGKVEFDYSIKQSSGWWTKIEKADLDSDGDIDFVLGNWGLNSKFKASASRPISMFVNDFDDNGQTEFIINTFGPEENKAFPFPTYEDLIAELPILKETIKDHHDYAGKTYEEIFTYQQRKGAEKKEVQILHSSLLINKKGKYELVELPIEAQVSPVYGIVIEDFNYDGHTDLLLLGNFHGLKPEVGRQASNYGVFLRNNGRLKYSFMPYHKTKTIIKGEVRDASVIRNDNQRYIVIARNNDKLLIFQ